MKNIEIKKKIIETARERFSSFGYTNTSLDELAIELSISKKTFYKHFVNKEAILMRVVEEFENEVKSRIKEMLNGEGDLRSKTHQILSYAGLKVSSINPYLIEDVKINAPKVWNKIQTIKSEIIFQLGNTLLKEGIKSGLVRKTVNKTLAIMLYASAMETIMTPNFTRQIPEEMLKDLPYAPNDVFNGLVDIIFNGILI